MCPRPTARDASILGRWKAEYIAQGVKDASLNYVWQQLEDEASHWPGPLTGGAVPGVYTSDGQVPAEVLEALLREAGALEVAGPKDWHPGSDEQASTQLPATS